MKLFGFEIKRESRASPENPRYSLSDPAILDAVSVGDDGSVTPQSAMQSAAVFSCVKILAEGIAQLPLRLYRRDGNRREIVTDHPLNDLLSLQPNPVMTRSTYMEQQVAQQALWGNCYAQRIFDRRTDRTFGLYPLKSQEVKPYVEQVVENGIPSLRKRYRIRGEIFEAEDVLHVPLLSLTESRASRRSRSIDSA
jgi:HK97 family phage portal protein